MCNVVVESFLPALHSVHPFLLLADVDKTSDSTDTFQFWFSGVQNWTDVKIQCVHGPSDFCDPSIETDVLYRVPELSERVYCLFIGNQQSKSAGTLLPLTMHNIWRWHWEAFFYILFLLGHCGVKVKMLSNRRSCRRDARLPLARGSEYDQLCHICALVYSTQGRERFLLWHSIYAS